MLGLLRETQKEQWDELPQDFRPPLDGKWFSGDPLQPCVWKARVLARTCLARPFTHRLGSDATAVALPVYGVTVFGINMHNKAAIKHEFNRRRVPLPLTLGPGETRSGSFFFPMVPNPQTLTVRWTGSAGDGESTLELHFLQGLHVSGETH